MCGSEETVFSGMLVLRQVKGWQESRFGTPWLLGWLWQFRPTREFFSVTFFFVWGLISGLSRSWPMLKISVKGLFFSFDFQAQWFINVTIAAENPYLVFFFLQNTPDPGGYFLLGAEKRMLLFTMLILVSDKKCFLLSFNSVQNNATVVCWALSCRLVRSRIASRFGTDHVAGTSQF